jgi:uncharacterized protein (DUF58 family)
VLQAAGPPELHYRTALRPRSLRPGAHAGPVVGPGLAPAPSVPLARARDWRRLDLATTLRDPFGQLWVRQAQQRSALRVWLLVDQSASMQRWQAPLQAFAQALAQSALRQGDSFGLAGFAGPEDAAGALRLAPTRSHAAVAAALRQWAAEPWAGQGVQGLADTAARGLGAAGEPALVVLASDFLAPPAHWAAGLAALARHDLLPLWLGDPDELARLPRHGLGQVHDAETGQQRLLWLRPRLVQQWQAQAAAHRAAVGALLRQHQRVPLHLGRHFNADQLNRQLAQRVA